MRKLFASVALVLLAAAGAPAQDQPKPAKPASSKPPLSPPAHAEGAVNGKKITIDYSAPSKRDRVIMGGLVPYGKVWRTGANSATTLHTESDLQFGDLVVPAGTYTLYTLPGEKEWSLIVNKQTGQWGTEYHQEQDLGRVPMKVAHFDKPVETLGISLEPASGGKATLTLKWETTEASVPITAHK